MSLSGVLEHDITTRDSNEFRGRSPERFIIALECFDTMIKHAERAVKIPS